MEEVNAVLARVWLDEFVVKGLCGLCGNTGKISHVVKSPIGDNAVLLDAHCICPNGRALKGAKNEG